MASNVVFKQTNWAALVAQADPEHARKSRVVREYEFTAAPRGNDRNHDGGNRVFMGDYQNRGPYGSDE